MSLYVAFVVGFFFFLLKQVYGLNSLVVFYLVD